MTGSDDTSGTGNDRANVIRGNAGGNVMTGGLGADDLYSRNSGFDVDKFIYNSTGASGVTAPTMDQIYGFDPFSGGGEANWDRIDLSGLNLGAGRVKFIDLGANVNVAVNTDSDPAAEMIIQVVGVGALSMADLICRIAGHGG